MALTEAEDSDILIYVKKIEVALFMSRISDGVNNDMTVIKRMESYRFEEILQRGDTSRVSPLFVSWVTRISRKMAFAKGNCECMGGKMLKRQPISKNQNPDL